MIKPELFQGAIPQQLEESFDKVYQQLAEKGLSTNELENIWEYIVFLHDESENPKNEI